MGYRTDVFPAFYTQHSGIKVSLRLDTPEEIVMLARTHWELGMSSAILVAVPPPGEVAMDAEDVKKAIRQALTAASREKITGHAVTPYLLEKVRQHTGGESLRANLGLLLNNAEVAGQIARAIGSL